MCLCAGCGRLLDCSERRLKLSTVESSQTVIYIFLTLIADVYKLDVFAKDGRPEACVEADPENPVCQLLGDYQLRLDTGPGK